MRDHRVQNHRTRHTLVRNPRENLRVRAVLDEIHRRRRRSAKRRLRRRLRFFVSLLGRLRVLRLGGRLHVFRVFVRPRLGLRARARERARDRLRVVAGHARDVGFGAPKRVLVGGERRDAARRRRRRRQRRRVDVLSPGKVQGQDSHETRWGIELEGVSHRPRVRIHQRRHERWVLVILLRRLRSRDVAVRRRRVVRGVLRVGGSVDTLPREVHQADDGEARSREIREPPHGVLRRRLGAVHPGKKIFGERVRLGNLRGLRARRLRRRFGAPRDGCRVLGEAHLLIRVGQDIGVRARARPVVLLVVLVPGRHRRGVFPGLRLERLTRRRRRLRRLRRRRRRRRVRRLRRVVRDRAPRGDSLAVRCFISLRERAEQTRDQIWGDKKLALVGVLGLGVRRLRGDDGGVRVAQRGALGRGGRGFAKLVVRQVREHQGALIRGGGRGRTIDTLGGGFAEPDERRRHRRGVDAGRAGFEHERDRAPIQLERGRGRGRLRLRLRTMNDNAWWVRG